MSENTATPSDLETVENIKAIKRGIEVQVAQIKRELALWLEQTRCPSQSTSTRIALLEIALDQCLAELTATAADLNAASADAFDMIQAVFRRAVQRRRVALQLNTSRLTPAGAVPINDKEWAAQLTEMVKRLDELAQPLAKDARLRQLIDDVFEPLDFLLGYVAGGIDNAAVG
jgi:AcrR family transcriptional regulator